MTALEEIWCSCLQASCDAAAWARAGGKGLPRLPSPASAHSPAQEPTASDTVPHLVLGQAAAGTAGAAAPCKNRRESFARRVGCGSEGSEASLESQEFLEKSVLLERLQIGCGKQWG